MSKKISSNASDSYKYDLIILVSGGIRGKDSVPPWVQTRVDKAIELHGQTKYILATSAFTPYKALPLDQKGQPLYESTVMANILLKHNVPQEKIILDNYSQDTLGNATFARFMVADPLQLKNILIITSEFHMPRTELIFEHIFSLVPKSQQFQLTFITTKDQDMPKEQKEARMQKEKKSIEHYKANHQSKTTVTQMQKYMLLEHGAYTVRPNIWKQSQDTKNSY